METIRLFSSVMCFGIDTINPPPLSSASPSHFALIPALSRNSSLRSWDSGAMGMAGVTRCCLRSGYDCTLPVYTLGILPPTAGSVIGLLAGNSGSLEKSLGDSRTYDGKHTLKIQVM